MATFVRLGSGNWRVQVGRKGWYMGETFRRRQDAEEWARDNESRIARGEKPRASGHTDPTTFGHLIDLHLADMKEVGKCPRRSINRDPSRARSSGYPQHTNSADQPVLARLASGVATSTVFTPPISDSGGHSCPEGSPFDRRISFPSAKRVRSISEGPQSDEQRGLLVDPLHTLARDCSHGNGSDLSEHRESEL